VAVFTLASAVVYVVNDLSDRDRDRLHPVKRHRPLAAGRVSTRSALTLVGGLGAALAAAFATGSGAWWWPAALYLGISFAYSRGLKHIPLLDAFIVATGFVLRLVQGCVVLDRPVPSGWPPASSASACCSRSASGGTNSPAPEAATAPPCAATPSPSSTTWSSWSPG